MEEHCGYHSSVVYPMETTQPENVLSYLPLVNYSTQPPAFEEHVCGLSGSSPGISDADSVIAEIPRAGFEDDRVSSTAIRAKIASHPLYPKLLQAHIDCHKVGTPPGIATMLDEMGGADERGLDLVPCSVDADPQLDHFMETYCEMLVKFKSDLSKPFDEATTFLNNIQMQLSHLCNGSSEEELTGGEMVPHDYHKNGDPQLKDKLLEKYSGYISTLKHEFSKHKKKGKLPRDARQILLHWWDLHYKWPYPTEADKVGLAEATGLDQKQINNWFINQRKRHWKPSGNMQIAIMDSLYGPFSMNV
ncbi:hypothetical protein J1N35_027854 [Gossypium stocksii]|uniref:Homeobox protein knotted-1-like 6 n=1 Tax=Gossypium stocksii TaxID=47602 RepID=A0A9D4A001_9ROSI|nr:hypothetical protein J1N35_027854 [Gossypium stocksii]